MRKTRVFVAVTTAAVAASVCAFASEQENKKAEDAYLILDLEKAGIEELQKKDDNGEAYGTYLDLAASDHDGYPVKDMPPMPPMQPHQEILSAREIEVLVLITKGLINKEIADKLNISLTTVITHRKNITEKLGIKSVSGLTIYAVMNGYIEADRI